MSSDLELEFLLDLLLLWWLLSELLSDCGGRFFLFLELGPRLESLLQFDWPWPLPLPFRWLDFLELPTRAVALAFVTISAACWMSSLIRIWVRPFQVSVSNWRRRVLTIDLNLESRVSPLRTCDINSKSVMGSLVLASWVWYCCSFAKNAEMGPFPVCLSLRNWSRRIKGPEFEVRESSWFLRVSYMSFGLVFPKT